jgi:hypothetical protein
MSIKTKPIAIIFIVVFIVSGYWYLTLEIIPEDLIAIVGGQKIFVSDLEKEMERRGGKRLHQIDKNVLLEEMILRCAMIEQALKSGIDKQPDFIRMYQNLLIGQYKKQYLKPQIDGVDFTAEEVRSYYTNHIEEYTQPAKARFAVIYMKIHSKMTDDRKKTVMNRMIEARESASKQNHGRGFGPIAVKYSEDQVTRYKGGDIGWVNKNRPYRWDKKILDAGFALKKINDISDIISTEQGLYIVKLLDQRPSKVIPFNKVKIRIRHKEILEKRKQVEKDFTDDVRHKTPVTIYHKALDRINLPENKEALTLPAPAL